HRHGSSSPFASKRDECVFRPAVDFDQTDRAHHRIRIYLRINQVLAFNPEIEMCWSRRRPMQHMSARSRWLVPFQAVILFSEGMAEWSMAVVLKTAVMT